MVRKGNAGQGSRGACKTPYWRTKRKNKKNKEVKK